MPPAQVVTVQLGNASGVPGSTVSVPVTLGGSAGGVAGLQLDVLFDAAALGATNPTCTAAAGRPLFWSLPSQPPAPAGQRRLRLLVFDAASPAPIGDGQLGTCQLHIASAAALGSYPLQGQGLAVSDAMGGTMNSSLSDATVLVTTCTGCGCGAAGALAMGGSGGERAGFDGTSIWISAAQLKARSRSADAGAERSVEFELDGLVPQAALGGRVSLRGELADLGAQDLVVSWEERGGKLSGRVTGLDGKPLAEFDGALGEGRGLGRVRRAGGEASDWRWDAGQE